MNKSRNTKANIKLFESYLSQYLTENPQLFQKIYVKLFQAIEAFILSNQKDSQFDRALFAIQSAMLLEGYHYERIQDLGHCRDLFKVNFFLKLLCDYSPKNKITFTTLDREKAELPALSVLCQRSLFANLTGRKQVQALLHSQALFAEKNRGVRAKRVIDPISTKKLGIMSLEETPAELLNYFANPHEPVQFDYIPLPKSNVGAWLTFYQLPIISGCSGSARDILLFLPRILPLEAHELQLLLISQAATLVAKGHHSYFEVLLLLHQFGFTLKKPENLLDLYIQTLPKDIRLTASFQAFMQTELCQSIQSINFDLEAEPPCQGIASLRA